MPKIEAKRYTKDEVNTIFSKDYEKTSESTGNVFPTNRIVVETVKYSGTYEDKDKNNVAYKGEKIEITNFKLTLEDGNIVKKKKVIGNRAVDEKTAISMSEEQFADLVQGIKDIA
ncbi:MAG: hypothetical protein Q9M94_05515 [Candidatus Gracilibacteria bacterium]|nr:hypothetical protein [Candidatus Gracilibacteria bacterium]